jgi:hypothetical protein
MTKGDTREDRARAIVNAFLQNKSMEQNLDYLARGRRFAKLAVGQLKEDWIIAVRSWLARKDQRDEMMMDDLASELRLRRLEPPYRAVEQELANHFAHAEEAKQKEKIREVAHEIGEFVREYKCRSGKS